VKQVKGVSPTPFSFFQGETMQLRTNKKRSREIASIVGIVQNGCFRNCFWGVRHLNKGRFHLGQIYLEGIVYRHCWLTENNFILDPSLVHIVDIASIKYFSRYEWTYRQTRKLSMVRYKKIVDPTFLEWHEIPVQFPFEAVAF
jgi:hypothetical protein